jgi:hypothetical protein
LTNADPQLRPLQLNAPENTPTIAIAPASPARNNADPSTSTTFDQRGFTRATDGGYDIGGVEYYLRCIRVRDIYIPVNLNIQVSPSAGGVADPAAGSYPERPDSIVALKATPKAGFSFSQWAGNVVDPFSASTTVSMNTDQTVIANFVSGNTVLGGNILTKSGPQNARIWPITISAAGVVVARNAQIASFTLTQVAGTACTPVLLTPLPAVVGDLNPGASAAVNLTFDFAGCVAAARFTAQATFSANGGGVTGSMTRTNQFQ